MKYQTNKQIQKYVLTECIFFINVRKIVNFMNMYNYNMWNIFAMWNTCLKKNNKHLLIS